MKKPSGLSILIEVVLGVGLIILGVFKPAFIFRLDFVQSIKGPLGDTIFGILCIVGGILLLCWTVFQLIRSRNAEAS